ncbi:tyrosine-type recombinase/integrase [Paraburkholderia sp. RL17-337-BIB-A]|uniref:tyrosine-type recombinase/integrase n=1 Tax=Paraburkholderia sp. RL17-337-BIB-A TaxID=3031636 RepID=UPI0038BC26E7
MYKHVSLRRRQAGGRTTWQLLGPDGLPIAAFAAFAESLRNSPPNTRESYCRHLAEFFNYLIEVMAYHGQGQPLTKLQLADALEAYGEYLLLGTDASHPIAQAVAVSLPPGVNATSSLIPKKAALRRFLKLSETVRKELAELATVYNNRIVVAETSLLPGLGQKRQLQPQEVKAMRAHSMLAGVVSGGPQLIECVVLGDATEIVDYDESRAFPYDKVMDLIDAMPTERDKSIYSLLAASGCRTHEGLQTLLSDDVDVEEGTVHLVDPKTRPGHPSYRALSPSQRESLAWKGRTTDLTLLIEPFASVFFESLQRYLEREYIAHGRHDFLFQFLKGQQRGLPYFLSAPSSRLDVFQGACGRVGVSLPRGTGPHSLRHMYGTYVLNYFPRSNGDYGLPVPIVQQLLGHSDVKSTLKYARFDKDLRKLEIQHANRVLFRNGTPKKLLELKLEALEAQMAKVRSQIVQEGNTRG